MPTTPSGPSTPSPAQLAKAALRRLAEQRLEPTPDNYRQAYASEAGGSDQPVPPAADDASASPLAAQATTAKSDSQEGQRWGSLIERVVRGVERGGRQWTAARKKDSLQRVLASSKSSATRLHQRLSQLVQGWDSDTLDEQLLNETGLASGEAGDFASALASAQNTPGVTATTAHASAVGIQAPPPVATTTPQDWPELAQWAAAELLETLQSGLPVLPSPTPGPEGETSQATSTQAGELALGASLAARLAHLRDLPGDSPQASVASAKQDLAQACQQARRVMAHHQHWTSEVAQLCLSLTDSLVDLAEDDSWVQGQCLAMRHQVETGWHARGVRHVQQLIEDARQRQRQLKGERAAARDALKQLIHQMLQDIGQLGETTDRFQDNLGRYAQTISQADSLESLTGLVRDMVQDSQAVRSVVASTQVRLQQEHSKATELSERVRSLEAEIRKLSDEVSTDPLTQIANRRGMMRAFESEQARAQRQGSALAIALLDVDNFKRLNDQLGHQTGDEALKFLARRVCECLRPVDVVARYGGEEFVVMLPETDASEGQQTLTRLQRTLTAEFFTHEDKQVFITFSAGVTLYRGGESIEAALERADVALYEAKRTGKNRTCIN